jgi:hypothetical protein
LKLLQATGFVLTGFERKNNQLLSNNILRNACTIATSETSFLLCSIKSDIGDKLELHIYEQSRKPYAMFECKRVGVEEGMTKGPQTIEKAKLRLSNFSAHKTLLILCSNGKDRYQQKTS